MKKRLLVATVCALFALSTVGVVLAQDKAPAGPPPVLKEMVAKAKGSVQKVSAAEGVGRGTGNPFSTGPRSL